MIISKSKNNNCLHFDVDHTMIHSLYASSEKDADELLYTYGEYNYGIKYQVRGLWYVSFLRNCTKELLSFSRQLLGNDNVYMLSTGILEYITAVNQKFELEFNPNTNIYGREDIEGYFIHPKFAGKHNILIDDMDWYFHTEGRHNKVLFLDNLPYDNLLQVSNFNVNWEDPIDDTYVSDLKERIVEAFNY